MIITLFCIDKGEYHLKTLKNNMLIDLVCLKNDAENDQLHQR